ncbi:17502_t:CDS:2 [Funneliformis caledonium]|uniref:17502_t:CDS:1 n=1 Tax=Funneliformis caledonium TaxID=1117310 RepID=A0A9N9BV26_9GLOM|nr:17502_t:CDS:2 [Funneliformis caledonium]
MYYFDINDRVYTQRKVIDGDEVECGVRFFTLDQPEIYSNLHEKYSIYV